MGGAALAFLAGGATAGIVVAVMVGVKRREIERRVSGLRQSIRGDAGARGDLAEQAAQLRDSLVRGTIPYAETVARRSAENYLGQAYGLTPDRIAGIETLVRRFA